MQHQDETNPLDPRSLDRNGSVSQSVYSSLDDTGTIPYIIENMPLANQPNQNEGDLAPHGGASDPNCLRLRIDISDGTTSDVPMSWSVSYPVQITD